MTLPPFIQIGIKPFFVEDKISLGLYIPLSKKVLRIRGIGKDGKEHTYYVYNNCSHRAAYEETGMQGVSYTTGVPAMIGAMMFLTGKWVKPGVRNVEEFDPDPFMKQLHTQGLPWHEIHDGDLEL